MHQLHRDNNISVKRPTAVAAGIVQEVTVTDESASIITSAWESDVDIFQVCQTYNFYNVRVRSFRNDKLLSLTRQSKYSLCEDPAKQVLVEQEENDAECRTIGNAAIIGLTNFVIHRCCKKCKGKLNPKNTALWVCCNCSMVQTITNVTIEFSATLTFEIAPQEQSMTSSLRQEQ